MVLHENSLFLVPLVVVDLKYIYVASYFRTAATKSRINVFSISLSGLDVCLLCIAELSVLNTEKKYC